jgi:uncharacterized protein
MAWTGEPLIHSLKYFAEMTVKNPIKSLKDICSLKDEPKVIAKGFALGSFIGMLPIPGFQLIVSLGIATLLKLNKKAACIAVFNTNLITGAFVFSFTYWLGKKLLGVNPSFSIGDTVNYHFIVNILQAGSDVFLSLLAGGILTGLFTCTLSYWLIMKILAYRMQATKQVKHIHTTESTIF